MQNSTHEPAFVAVVYNFTLILAVFLAGLGLGSSLAAMWVQRAGRTLAWLAAAQLAIVCLGPYANFMIARVLPYWRRPSVIESLDVYAVFTHDTLRTAVATPGGSHSTAFSM